MDTGAIIALAVIAAIILIALFVALPRMRKASAERKADQARRERERELEQAREERAEHHRTEADVRMKQAELSEQEARKARAEAEINTKRAELHEQGLADEELGIDRGDDFRRVEGGRAHEPVADTTTDGGRFERTDTRATGRDGEIEREEVRETGTGEGERRFVRSEERVTETEPEHRTTR